MSTPNSCLAQIGETIQHEEQAWWVVRIVDSTTLFQDGANCYLLVEKYAQLRHQETGEVAFKTFSQVKHEITTVAKGLDPAIWRKM